MKTHTTGRCSVARGRGELTSLTNVSASAEDDLSLRARLGCVRLGGVAGRDSWDRFVVECPVAVVGTVEASSEYWEKVDSSKLTPTIAGWYVIL